MLQQTQVNRVIPYYTRFLDRFPTVETLASTSWEEFLPYYQGLGYYARGRNMLKTAQVVTKKYDGVFPKDRHLLLELPGIGEYTADAILSFGYGQKCLAVDTNVKQIVGAFFLGSAVDWPTVRRQLSPLAPEINSALMDFAACSRTSESIYGFPALQGICTYVQMTQRAKKAVSKQDAFPSKSAQTVLVLHENHRLYFSSEEQKYSPFILPTPLNSRNRIKEYFRRQYGLELSVRPPRAKGFLDNQSTMVVFAQILSGTHAFSSFSPAEAKPVWQAILDSLG